jgi:hypothetical protein
MGILPVPSIDEKDFCNRSKEISSFEKVVPTAENIAVIGQLWRSPVRELGAEHW